MDWCESLFKVQFKSNAHELQKIRAALRAELVQYCSEQKIIEHIVLAVNEACMNIIQHAYGKSRRGEIILQMFDCGDDLIFQLTDFAKKIDPHNIKPRRYEDIRPGGLGVHFIHEVMDQVRYSNTAQKSGNVMIMTKCLRNSV